jgi:MFS family permease
MRFRGPLVESYPSAVVLVLLALCPYLALTTASLPLEPLIHRDVGVSETWLALTAGLANAAYSFGCVLAAQLAQKLPGRRLLLLYAVLFVVGSVLAAWTPAPAAYVAGRIVQGFTTGLMLIAAVPPLVLRWPTSKLPRTAVVMNMGIFGATALGPLIGGVAAGADAWRLLSWVVAGLGAATVLLVLLTFEDQEPADLSVRWDPIGIALCAAACGSLFFAVSYLPASSLASPAVLVPFVVGAVALLGALVWEFFSRHALMPIRGLAHTIPVAGISTAMIAGASSVALIQLAQTTLQAKGVSPTHAGLLFFPEFGAAIVAAVAFGALFRTRYTPLLALGGLLLLGAGGGLVVAATSEPDALVAIAACLIGLGTGLSVAPALFISGFSLPSANLPRIFALIELLRGVAAFLAGPLLLQLAESLGGIAGLRTASWVALALPLAGAAFVLAVFLLGHGRLQEPDLDAWVDGDEPAVRSAPLLAAARRSAAVAYE